MDVVFSPQRLGEDAVFSLQFLSGEQVTTGGGFPARTAAPESRRRAVERAELSEQPEALARAEEIAEAAVARAAVPPRSLAQLAESEQAAPVSLLQVMQLWVSPAEPPPTAQTVVEFVNTPGPTLAQLDEDAILAATVLLFSRRG
jgi:hypothetical protein